MRDDGLKLPDVDWNHEHSPAYLTRAGSQEPVHKKRLTRSGWLFRAGYMAGSDENGRRSKLIYARCAPDRHCVADLPGDILG